jgi:hypothetical protein
MIGHKLPNKTKSATVAESKFFSPTKQALVSIAAQEQIASSSRALEQQA